MMVLNIKVCIYVKYSHKLATLYLQRPYLCIEIGLIGFDGPASYIVSSGMV